MRKHFLILAGMVMAAGLLWSMAVYADGKCCNGWRSDNGTSPWSVVSAADHSVGSCAYGDVNYCVNTVAQAGDTVLVGAGTAVWSNQLVITKGIILKGAGSGTGPGDTVIIGDYTAPSPTNYNDSSEDFLIAYAPTTPSDREAFRLTGFNITVKKIGGVGQSLLLQLRNDTAYTLATVPNRIRVDHNTFNSGRQIVMHVKLMWGVMDNNTFNNCSKIANEDNNNITGWNSDLCPFKYGAGQAMYIEDNTFNMPDNTTAIGTGYSGRDVVRYNDFNWPGLAEGKNMVDIHNVDPQYFGGMGVEVYGNNVNATGPRSVILLSHRGGKALCFYNQINSDPSIARLSVRQEDPANSQAASNCTGTSGYGYLVNDSYYFNNRHGASRIELPEAPYTSDWSFTGKMEGAHSAEDTEIKENISFFRSNDSCTKDVCDAGVGMGSDTPTGACAEGVGYWKTSQSTSGTTGMVGVHPKTWIIGTLYKCVEISPGVREWQEYYKPYDYPHPLRSDPVVGDEPPAPPASEASGDSGGGGGGCFISALPGGYLWFMVLGAALILGRVVRRKAKSRIKRYGGVLRQGHIRMEKIMKKTIVEVSVMLFFCLATVPAQATVIRAASCSQAHVQAAINAARDGDIVLMPEGTADWTSVVTLAHKSITLQGAGIGKTVIRNAAGIYVYVFQIIGDEGKSFRVTDTTFMPNQYMIQILGTCKNFRIDHCEFICVGFDGSAVTTTGYTYGLIDHCSLDQCEIGVMDDINPAWQRPLTLGTSHAVYIEDCYYRSTVESDAIDGRDGTRYVFRYNYLTNQFAHAHDGCNAGGYVRGAFSCEVYHNTIQHTERWWPVVLRSGTAVVFNNTFKGPEDRAAIRVYYPRSRGLAGCGAIDIWGPCDGTSIYDGNLPIDNDTATYTGNHSGSNGQSVLTCSGKSWAVNSLVGYAVWNVSDSSRGKITANTVNTITVTLSGGARNVWNTGDGFKITNGYPCLDQQGRSTDLGLLTPQSSEPMYEWGNVYNGHGVGIEVANDDKPYHHIEENRDFFNDTSRPGYVPYPYPHPLSVQGESGRRLNLRKNTAGNQVDLIWDAVSGVNGYGVSRDWGAIIPVFSTSYTDNNPAQVYIVYAYAGGKILAMEGVNADDQAPSVPSNLQATAKTSSSVTLVWDAAHDNFGVLGYRVYQGSDPVCVANVSGVTTVTVFNLKSATTYSFMASAYDAGGNESAKSDSVSVTTNAGFTISGKVTLNGAGLADVILAGLHSVIKTNADGEYMVAVDQGWDGTVIPGLGGYIFRPASIAYSGVTSNQGDQNYTATPSGGGGGTGDASAGGGGGGCFISAIEPVSGKAGTAFRGQTALILFGLLLSGTAMVMRSRKRTAP